MQRVDFSLLRTFNHSQQDSNETLPAPAAGIRMRRCMLYNVSTSGTPPLHCFLWKSLQGPLRYARPTNELRHATSYIVQM